MKSISFESRYSFKGVIKFQLRLFMRVTLLTKGKHCTRQLMYAFCYKCVLCSEAGRVGNNYIVVVIVPL